MDQQNNFICYCMFLWLTNYYNHFFQWFLNALSKCSLQVEKKVKKILSSQEILAKSWKSCLYEPLHLASEFSQLCKIFLTCQENSDTSRDLPKIKRQISGKCHTGGIVENSVPYRIYIDIRALHYVSGLLEGQNFNNLHKQVYGPIEREMNECGWWWKIQRCYRN